MTDSNDRKRGVDPDGIRVFQEGPGRRTARVRLVIAIVAIATTLVVVLTTTALLLLRREPDVQTTRDVSIPVRETPSVPTKRIVQAPAGTPRDPAVAGEPARDSSRPERPGPDAVKGGAPTAAPTPPARRDEERSLEGLVRDVYEGLRSHGDGEGIAAYPPKGTNPPKPGLVVPDNFQLPEGYVRYYQVTDEGQRLEPILMFSPDFDFVDPSGNPIALPANGIVPPEMAPPGLPLRTLQIPGDPHAAAGPRDSGR